MSDIIQLLPDSVANQIAAGEVIQRPASVVKELLENAIDAGSTSIKLIIKDAGKTLIQVIDNGCGMSETDARISFERHATSKIRKADDLFSITTKGFRGEALASIAAIAHVELKTKACGEELGTLIAMEGSEIKAQEPCSCSEGSSFSVKNLFYNVPARRNFLKSDPVETRHIIEEFQRVAFTHPEVGMQMYHNENEVFNLPSGSLRQRVVGILGKKYNQKLVPVEEETNIVNIKGFIGKPEYARKTRGEQYFFVNNRYIRSPYLNHAIQRAFEELISKDHYPSYFLYLNIDPSLIDINIHPTKTEIKFEDEKSIYAIVHSTVKSSLGKYNIAPSLDFEQETSFNPPEITRNTEIVAPVIQVDPNYNPFDTGSKSASTASTSSSTTTSHSHAKKNVDQWEELFRASKDFNVDKTEEQQVISASWDEPEVTNKITYQLHNKYILTHIKSGFIIIDQQRAHERVLYEKHLQALEQQQGNSQQLLFPEHVELNEKDFLLVKELEEDIRALGFNLAEFGKNTYAINGIPTDAATQKEVSAKQLLEQLLEQYGHHVDELKLDRREGLAQSLARSMSIKPGKVLHPEEMHHLIDALFACEIPYYAPNSKPTIITFTLEELDQQFDR